MSEQTAREKKELNELLHHHHLCEIMPSVCEDSGQAEWSRGELQKMIDAFMELTEYWKWRGDLERERRENKACKEVILELEAKLKAFEFMTGGGRDDVRYSANKIACLEAEVKRLRNKFGKDENGEFIYNDQEIIDALKDERAWNQTLRNEITTLKQSLEQARELIRKAVDSECDHGLEINPVPCGLCDDEIRAFLTSPPQEVKETESVILICSKCGKDCDDLGEHIFCNKCLDKMIPEPSPKKPEIEEKIIKRVHARSRKVAELEDWPGGTDELASAIAGIAFEAMKAMRLKEGS